MKGELMHRTPWRVRDARYARVHVVDNEGRMVCECPAATKADFIVLACNAHDALVEVQSAARFFYNHVNRASDQAYIDHRLLSALAAASEHLGEDDR